MTPTLSEIIFPPDNFNLEFQILEGYKKSKVFDFKNPKKRKRIVSGNSISYLIFYFILILENILFSLKDILL